MFILKNQVLYTHTTQKRFKWNANGTERHRDLASPVQAVQLPSFVFIDLRYLNYVSQIHARAYYIRVLLFNYTTILSVEGDSTAVTSEFPSQRVSNTEHWYSSWCAPEKNDWTNSAVAGDLRRLDANVKSLQCYRKWLLSTVNILVSVPVVMPICSCFYRTSPDVI